MTCDDQTNLVCHKQVESLLLWPNAKTTMHLQEMQFSLAPSKPGCNKLDDVSYYRCAMTKETGFHPVRYRQEKSVTPYTVTQTSRDRFRSTLNVTLVRTEEGVKIQDGEYKRGLEIIN